MKIFVWALLTTIVAVLSAAPARSSNDDRAPARIANPAQAPSLRTVHLKELWRVGGDTEAEGEVFGKIGDLAVDGDGNVYLLDRQVLDVRMFSPDGTYIRSFGREGEGPGEFRQPKGIVVTPANQIGVYQSHPVKLILFDRSGTPTGDLNFELDTEHSMQYLGRVQCGRDSFLVSVTESSTSATALDQVDRLVRFTADGKFQCELSRSVRHLDLGKPVTREYRPVWAAYTTSGVAYVSSNWNYEVNVNGRDCRDDRVITREYKHRRRTNDEVAAVESYYRGAGGTQGVQLDISKYDADINWMGVTGNDQLWVLSSRGWRGLTKNSLGVFDVYNDSGVLVEAIDLRAEGSRETDGYYLAGDRFYVVRHVRPAKDEKIEDAEPMSVICYQIPGR